MAAGVLMVSYVLQMSPPANAFICCMLKLVGSGPRADESELKEHSSPVTLRYNSQKYWKIQPGW